MTQEHLEKIEQRIELRFCYSGDLTEEKVVSEIMATLRKADPGCWIIMSPIKSDEEKDKEISRLKLELEGMYANNKEGWTKVERFEKEIERLKGLLKSLRHCGVSSCESCNKDWQQFKTENNL